jgi:hypothetical protein
VRLAKLLLLIKRRHDVGMLYQLAGVLALFFAVAETLRQEQEALESDLFFDLFVKLEHTGVDLALKLLTVLGVEWSQPVQ